MGGLCKGEVKKRKSDKIRLQGWRRSRFTREVQEPELSRIIDHSDRSMLS